MSRPFVFPLQQGLDQFIKITEECGYRTGPLNLEMAADAVSVAMQISALIRQLFVAVSRVEFVFLLD